MANECGSIRAPNTNFFAKIIRLILWSNLAQIFLKSVKSSNFYAPSSGSRPRVGNLGRVKAVTSNRERTLRLSQSGLLFCSVVEEILPHKFLCWDSTVDVFLFLETMSFTSSDSEMTFDSEDTEIHYIARQVGFNKSRGIR